MQKAIIGKKIGMTQIFDENGKVIPVTVVEAGPCTIVQKKTVENDGYAAVQMGYGDVKPQRLNKPEKGHFAKADVAPKKTLKEFRLDNSDALNVGDVVKVLVRFTDRLVLWVLVLPRPVSIRARECQVTWVQKQLPCRIWKSLRLTLKIISSQSRVRSRARRAASWPSLTA